MMKNSRRMTAIFLVSSLSSYPAQSCMEHYGYGFGGNHGGFFNYSSNIADINELAKDVKVFKVNHPSAAIAEVQKEETLELDYELPLESENVRLTLSATNNITMIDQVFDLKQKSGKIIARFLARKKGINAITVTIAGEHEGERLSYTSELYIKAKKTS